MSFVSFGEAEFENLQSSHCQGDPAPLANNTFAQAIHPDEDEDVSQLIMAAKYIPFEPVTVEIDGKEYTGVYRVDQKQKMMFVEWSGKSKKVQLLHTPKIEVLAQTVLSELVLGK
jgi:hypothetical protein